MGSMLPTVKYKVIGTGVTGDPFRCDIPTYNFVEEISPTVWKIQVPTEFVKANGKLGNGKIRKMYKYSNRDLNKLPPDARTAVERWKSVDYEANEVP